MAHGWPLERGFGVAAGSGHPASTDETVQQGEDDETADTDTDPNDEILVVADPAGGGRALAMAVVAAATCFARRAVEEVLVRVDAGSTSELRAASGRAADDTARWGSGLSTGPRVVAVEERAHHRATLVVTTGALATGALQPVVRITARITILLELVDRAGTALSSAFFLGVALARARSAHSIGSGVLAFLAAIVVGVIANGTVLELACLSVTT